MQQHLFNKIQCTKHLRGKRIQYHGGRVSTGNGKSPCNPSCNEESASHHQPSSSYNQTGKPGIVCERESVESPCNLDMQPFGQPMQNNHATVDCQIDMKTMIMCAKWTKQPYKCSQYNLCSTRITTKCKYARNVPCATNQRKCQIKNYWSPGISA